MADEKYGEQQWFIDEKISDEAPEEFTDHVVESILEVERRFPDCRDCEKKRDCEIYEKKVMGVDFLRHIQVEDPEKAKELENYPPEMIAIAVMGPPGPGMAVEIRIEKVEFDEDSNDKDDVADDIPDLPKVERNPHSSSIKSPSAKVDWSGSSAKPGKDEW